MVGHLWPPIWANVSERQFENQKYTQAIGRQVSPVSIPNIIYILALQPRQESYYKAHLSQSLFPDHLSYLTFKIAQALPRPDITMLYHDVAVVVHHR